MPPAPGMMASGRAQHAEVGAQSQFEAASESVAGNGGDGRDGELGEAGEGPAQLAQELCHSVREYVSTCDLRGG